MSRGELDNKTLDKIEESLPKIDDLQKRITRLSPSIISMNFPHKSEIPIAGVCLIDAIRMVSEARISLQEIYAHRIYYLEKRNPRLEDTAIYFTQYYAINGFLRLYAAAEHLANAIVFSLEIDKSFLKKGTTYIQVGKYLQENILFLFFSIL